jgi:hypothetical protein
MKLVRNDNKIIFLDDENKEIMDLGFLTDEFVWNIYTDKQIVITRDIDELFYDNLSDIMNSSYIFGYDKLYFKNENEIIWLSDQYCRDIEDKNKSDKLSRLIIKKEDDRFIISAKNPYFEKLGIKNKIYVIGFSPNFDGVYAKNINTGLSFQTDIVYMYLNVYNHKQQILIKKK